MPIQKKAQWARLKVGVTAIIALIILGVLIFLLTGSGSVFASQAHIYTFLDDSAALTESSPVRLNGIVIGKVDHILLTGSTEPGKIVKMDMSILAKYLSQIPVDSKAGVGAENVLGSKFMNIKKGRSKETVHDGSTIASQDIPDFNDFMEQGNNLLTQLQGILRRVDVIVGQVESGKGSIGKLLVDEELYNRAIAIMAEAHTLVATLNSSKGTIGRLMNDDTLYNDVRGSISRLDSIMQGLQQGEGSAGKLLKDPALYDEARSAIADLRKIVAEIDSGQGTVGKLLKSDDIHNQILATMRRLDSILDKINSGQGTLGQLVVNQQLYENLNGATRELHLLMQDFRANPKKFLRIKLGLF
jgi:phospholipid/cholesterol/gamma-HCH transport system substrate-binding protein